MYNMQRGDIIHVKFQFDLETVVRIFPLKFLFSFIDSSTPTPCKYRHFLWYQPPFPPTHSVHNNRVQLSNIDWHNFDFYLTRYIKDIGLYI